MEQLLIYLLKSSASLALFYLCYLVMLRKEAYFGFNRWYLLGALLISSLLPFIPYNLIDLLAQTEYEASNIYLSYQLSAYQLSEVIIGKQIAESKGFDFINALLLIYCSGLILKTAQFIFRFIQLYFIKKKYQHLSIGIHVFVITENGTPTFSFLNHIFIPRELYENKKEFDAIIVHEKVHAEQYHSLDVIIAELIIIFQWFNPFAYLLRKLIRENHEFIADLYTLMSDMNLANYRNLLTVHASIIKTNALAHNFSYSLLKRRLFMMKKQKNPIRLGFGLLGALITSALVIVACSRSDQNAEQLGMKMSNAMASDSTYTEVENMPQYPGGIDSLISYLASNIVYPKVARENGTSGKVMVGFVIEKDGAVKEVDVIKGIGDGCDEEAARVIDEMPDWNPGSKDGKPVRVSYVIPISFTLDQSDKTEETYTVVEQMPEYPGGFKAMAKFLSEKIKYPEAAKKDSITGRVFVSFVVEKDGQVADVSLLRGIGGGCDEEAMRVVAMMPKWNPGIEKGKAVKVEYNLPIKFALN